MVDYDRITHKWLESPDNHQNESVSNLCIVKYEYSADKDEGQALEDNNSFQDNEGKKVIVN